jgi:hypothetical protein
MPPNFLAMGEDGDLPVVRCRVSRLASLEMYEDHMFVQTPNYSGSFVPLVKCCGIGIGSAGLDALTHVISRYIGKTCEFLC